MNPPKEFHEMVARVIDRMEAAEKHYGDKSLFSPTADLMREWEEEALDIMGWGYYIWRRIKKFQEKMERVGVL